MPASEPLRAKRLRTSQACQACRAHKIACDPSDAEDGTCERCRRMSKICVPHVPKVPVRATNRSRKELVRLEEKVDRLCERLEQGFSTEKPGGRREDSATEIDVSNDSERGVPSFSTISRTSVSEADRCPPLTPNLPWVRVDGEDLAFGARLLRRLGGPQPEKDISRLRNLTDHQALQLFERFRTFIPHWPFVLIDDSVSCDLLAQEKPFLLLSILAVASSSNEQLQMACEAAFRQVLANKVIVNGEKSVELLQGLLVFLAWHHQYLRHETQQIYQFLQIAIGMTVDLDLSEPASDEPEMDLRREPTKPKAHESYPQTRTSESYRALLGCYYTSCGLSILDCHRPHGLSYSKHLKQCALNLAKEARYPYDAYLPLTVNLLHILEKIRALFDFDTLETGAMDEVRCGISLNHMKDLLHSWKEEADASGIQHCAWLLSNYHYAHVYLHEKAQPIHNYKLAINSNSAIDPVPFRLSDVLSHVQSKKSFLDTIVNTRLGAMGEIAMVEWIQMVSALIVMARLASIVCIIGITKTKEELEQMRQYVAIEVYIDKLCDYMASQPPTYLFTWFQAIGAGLKKWVSEQRRDPRRINSSGQESNPYDVLWECSVAKEREAADGLQQLAESRPMPNVPGIVPPAGDPLCLFGNGALGLPDQMEDITFDETLWDNLIWGWPMGVM